MKFIKKSLKIFLKSVQNFSKSVQKFSRSVQNCLKSVQKFSKSDQKISKSVKNFSKIFKKRLKFFKKSPKYFLKNFLKKKVLKYEKLLQKFPKSHNFFFSLTLFNWLINVIAFQSSFQHFVTCYAWITIVLNILFISIVNISSKNIKKIFYVVCSFYQMAQFCMPFSAPCLQSKCWLAIPPCANSHVTLQNIKIIFYSKNIFKLKFTFHETPWNSIPFSRIEISSKILGRLRLKIIELM